CDTQARLRLCPDTFRPSLCRPSGALHHFPDNPGLNARGYPLNAPTGADPGSSRVSDSLKDRILQAPEVAPLALVKRAYLAFSQPLKAVPFQNETQTEFSRKT